MTTFYTCLTCKTIWAGHHTCNAGKSRIVVTVSTNSRGEGEQK